MMMMVVYDDDVDDDDDDDNDDDDDSQSWAPTRVGSVSWSKVERHNPGILSALIRDFVAVGDWKYMLH